MDTNHLLTVFCGLASALVWGMGDFSGGLAAKRTHVLAVLFTAQGAGAIMLTVLALATGESLPHSGNIALGAAAGLCGVVGLGAFYQGLACGRMGVVAPLSAVLAAAVPVLVAAFAEGLPALSTLCGFGLAGVSVWLLTASPGGRAGKQELFYALIAGVGFALFFIIVDQVSDESLFWPLVAARCTALALVGLFTAVRTPETGLSLGPGVLPVTLACGVFDAGGNALYAAAASYGRLDVAVVTSGLYPASTVLLAAIVLKERLVKRQWMGVAAALVALTLIAA